MFVQEGKSRLFYKVYGTGEHVVLAFHGYGQEHSHFYNIAAALPQVKVIAFDLFFHGRSVLSKKDMPLQKAFLARLIATFLAEHQISRFSVMAFSMGGKFALTLLEAFPDKIERVLLVAPDGISTSFWYSVATYPGWLQGLFKQTVVRPARFFKFINWLDKRRLVDRGLLKFAAYQMNDTQKRLRVYKSWVGYRTLTFDIRKIVGILKKRSSEDLQVMLEELTATAITASLKESFETIIREGVEKTLNLSELTLADVRTGKPDAKNKMLLPVTATLNTRANQPLPLRFEALKINGRYFLFQRMQWQTVN